ncbi:MAG: DUF4364 family protein [Clostridium sp.]|uniref:DUF4364 family protein n=1 Tax=Clostridium sp. TaxID=1506 RepID=UPI003F3EDAE5
MHKESSLELAENKLLVLYILKLLKQPITNTQLTEIVLENSFINYFTLQQYISELSEATFIQYIEVSDKKLISLTEKGDNVLSFFKDRISASQLTSIDEYIKNHIDLIKKELTIHSDYTLVKNNNFLVHIKALEDDLPLIDLKFSVPTKKQATYICGKWQENPSEIYNQIINLLFAE